MPDNLDPNEVEEAVLVMSGAAQRTNGHYELAPPPGSIGDLIDRYHAAAKAFEAAELAKQDARRVVDDYKRRLWDALCLANGAVLHNGRAYLPGSSPSLILFHQIRPTTTPVPNTQP